MPIAMPLADPVAAPAQAGAEPTRGSSPGMAGFSGVPASPAAEASPQDDATVPGLAWTSNGRLRDSSIASPDRSWSVAIHLSPFSAAIVGPLGLLAPLILWLIRKSQSPFNDDHGREIINFAISLALLHLLLACTLIGFLLWPVLWVVAAVSLVRAAIAASNGEYFRYPLTWRFLS